MTVGLGDFAPLGADADLNSAHGVFTLMGYVFFVFFGLSAMGAFVSSVQDFLHFSNDLAQSKIQGVMGEIAPAMLEIRPKFASRRRSGDEGRGGRDEDQAQNLPGGAVAEE